MKFDDRSYSISRRHFCALGFLGFSSFPFSAVLGAANRYDKLSAQRGNAWIAMLTWGLNSAELEKFENLGLVRWRDSQLQSASPVLPGHIQLLIDEMMISKMSAEEILALPDFKRPKIQENESLTSRRKSQREYQDRLSLLATEARRRFFLRAIYSKNQLLEKMVWFWGNHFSVTTRKSDIRAFIGDFEEKAIRPNSFGRFRDILGAVVRHPAMLRYLDNAENSVGRINENYARELMELHTLGVGGGYSQKDVQELARILTGVGVRLPNTDSSPPKMAPQFEKYYLQKGAFEFNPLRHDFGPKRFLGVDIKGQGLAELDEALDILASSPSTARFLSEKIAKFFVADVPPKFVVDEMSRVFQNTEGDIAAVLKSMFNALDSMPVLGGKFRDPMHFVIACTRLVYNDTGISNLDQLLIWTARMGEALYAHETPDGYPLDEKSWSSASQMNLRFEVARAIGSGGVALFSTNNGSLPKLPELGLADSLAVKSLLQEIGPDTRGALAQARTPQDWNTLLLASPEFMHR